MRKSGRNSPPPFLSNCCTWLSRPSRETLKPDWRRMLSTKASPMRPFRELMSTAGGVQEQEAGPSSDLQNQRVSFCRAPLLTDLPSQRGQADTSDRLRDRNPCLVTVAFLPSLSLASPKPDRRKIDVTKTRTTKTGRQRESARRTHLPQRALAEAIELYRRAGYVPFPAR